MAATQVSYQLSPLTQFDMTDAKTHPVESPEFQPRVRVLIGSINHEWEFVTHIVVQIEQDDDGSYIVSDDEFRIYGIGDTQQRAERDYVASLIEYYEIIEESASHNNRYSDRLLQKLQNHILRK